MAALSLTEIRDAFFEEESTGGFGSESTPLQHLPDHKKRAQPVTPRLADDQVVLRKERTSKSHKDAARAAERTARTHGRSELVRLLSNSMIMTVGLAIHFAVSRTMTRYFDDNYVGSVNQMVIVFIYPVAAILAVWHLKNSYS